MNDIPLDNRFKIIEKAKKHILESTNIDTSKEEMECLDNFLFRCWQMGWLDCYDSDKKDGHISELVTQNQKLINEIYCKRETVNFYQNKCVNKDKEINQLLSDKDKLEKELSRKTFELLDKTDALKLYKKAFGLVCKYGADVFHDDVKAWKMHFLEKAKGEQNEN